MVRQVWCVFVSGCFVGLPPVSERGWLDSAAPLELPACTSVSIEPDDAESEERLSLFGLLTETPRTLCGTIDRASNDGQTYTGDVDYALFHTIDAGEVVLSLRWDGTTDLDLQGYDGNSEQWTASDSDTLELDLEPGYHLVLVAGLDGPPADYVLTGVLR